MEKKKLLVLTLSSLSILGYLVMPTASLLTITIQVVLLGLSCVCYYYFRKYLEATPAGSLTVNHYILISFTMLACFLLGYMHLLILGSYMFQFQIQKIIDSNETSLICSLFSPLFLVTPLCFHLLYMTGLKLYITVYPQRFLGINHEKLWRYLKVIVAVITVAVILLRLGTNGNTCNPKSAPFFSIFLGFKIKDETFIGNEATLSTVPLILFLACLFFLVASLIGIWKKYTTRQYGNLVHPNIQIGENLKLQVQELSVLYSKRLVQPQIKTAGLPQQDICNSLENQMNVEETAIEVHGTTKAIIHSQEQASSSAITFTHEQNTSCLQQKNHAKIVQMKSADSQNIISTTEIPVQNPKRLVEPPGALKCQDKSISFKELMENEVSYEVQRKAISVSHSNKKQEALSTRKQNMKGISGANFVKPSQRLVQPEKKTTDIFPQDKGNPLADEVSIEEGVVVVGTLKANTHCNSKQPHGYMSSVNGQNTVSFEEQANPAKIIYVRSADSQNISSLAEDQIERVPTDDTHSVTNPLAIISTSPKTITAWHQQKNTSKKLNIFRVLSLGGFVSGVISLFICLIVITVNPCANPKLSSMIIQLQLLVLELMPAWMMYNIPEARDFMQRKLKNLVGM